MAKTASMNDGETPAPKFDASKAVSAIAEATRLKTEQSEAAGEHGSYVKGVVDTLGVDKASFGFARKLNEMDPQKRQSTLMNLMRLTDALGHYAQGDMLGGPVELMAAIVKRHDNVKNGKPN